MSGLYSRLGRQVLPTLSLGMVLLAWMLSTPPGGYPDDTFHFANVWCDDGLAGYACSDVDGTALRNVPNALTDGNPWWITNGYGTNLRQPTEIYPRLYYHVMRMFAGESVVQTVVAMRLFNVMLTLGLAALAYSVMSPNRRFGLMASWLFGCAGLGFYYLASNHPIGWLVLGAATGWAFVNALIESQSWRKRGVAALGAIVSLILMLGSRPEGQLASVLVALVGIGTVDREARRQLAWKRLPRRRLGRWVVGGGLVGSLTLILWNLSATRINQYVLDSLRGIASPGFLSRAVDVPHSYLAGLASNVGSFHKGAFGAQSAFLLAAIVGASVLGIRTLQGVRSAALVIVSAAAFWAPLSFGDSGIGVLEIAPRYFLFFLLLFMGTALSVPSNWLFEGDRTVWLILGSILAVGHSLALHSAIRQYEVGASSEWELGLNSGLKWWWQWGPSPQSTWLLGTVAFAVLVAWVMHSGKTQIALGQA